MAPTRSKKPRQQWVLLAFRLPRVPSTPRIAVWRKLKRLGVAQLLDGLVALPLDNRNKEQLEWIAADVADAGGDAAIWIGYLESEIRSGDLASQMREEIVAEYRELIDDVERVRADPVSQHLRSLGRIRRELRRIRSRDYFPPDERELAQQAVDELARALTDVPA